MFDIEEIVATAVGRNGKPCLVQLATALGADGTTRGYAWWTARVVVTVGPGWVRVRRRLGVMGDDPPAPERQLDPPSRQGAPDTRGGGLGTGTKVVIALVILGGIIAAGWALAR
jgi:hypothetical protein